LPLKVFKLRSRNDDGIAFAGVDLNRSACRYRISFLGFSRYIGDFGKVIGKLSLRFISCIEAGLSEVKSSLRVKNSASPNFSGIERCEFLGG
jgi:hypothetical protein